MAAKFKGHANKLTTAKLFSLDPPKLKVFYSFIFREDDKRPVPTMHFPAAGMPVPQSSTPVMHIELSSVDISNGYVVADTTRFPLRLGLPFCLVFLVIMQMRQILK